MQANKWAYNIENFDENRNDFVAVADYCKNIIKEKQSKDEDCYNWISISYGEMYYDGEKLLLSAELQDSFERVKDSFPHKDARLDIIRCYGDVVYFCTHNGQYSVVYSPNKKPKSVDSADEKEAVFVKKIDENWYHVRKNNY